MNTPASLLPALLTALLFIALPSLVSSVDNPICVSYKFKAKAGDFLVSVFFSFANKLPFLLSNILIGGLSFFLLYMAGACSIETTMSSCTFLSKQASMMTNLTNIGNKVAAMTSDPSCRSFIDKIVCKKRFGNASQVHKDIWARSACSTYSSQPGKARNHMCLALFILDF
uniref:Uncharacterized protein n=1 Tax=Guillardia theta TaxID=55529 RepID=A0A7S4K7K1_GUITH